MTEYKNIVFLSAYAPVGAKPTYDSGEAFKPTYDARPTCDIAGPARKSFHRPRTLTVSLLAALACFSLPAHAALYITIVQGLEGEPSYGERFTEQTHQITQASIAINSEDQVTTFSGEEATRENVLTHFTELAAAMDDDDRAALYLIGHGSFDGETYKFNIPGPDLTATDLDEILTSLPGRNHFILNSSSTSGAMLDLVEKESRILITATRNGNERNSTEFGTFFAEALSSDEADINKNSNISIQEAFDFADRRTADFYTDAGKLATEHPQLRGEQASAFTIGTVMAMTVADADEDPEITRLLERQRELDDQIENLQLNRSTFSNTEYTERLRELVLQSAQVLEELDALQNPDN